ncbi:MAG: arsenic resistance N-acetyltransferase ArsN2 [Polyangiaceae bacterium]
MPHEVTIESANLSDLAAVAAMVGALDLPTDGIADQFPHAYAKATRDGLIVGCAGLEAYGKAGLLRSVAVSASLQRDGIGRRLVADRVAHARGAGLDAVYLLTTTAADYFPRLGFVPCERGSVPAALAASPEFASVCPTSAKCLVLRL